MESEAVHPAPMGPNDARLALHEADEARDRLTGGVRLPAGLYPVLATAVAVQLATAAYGISRQTTAGLVVLLAGLAVFLLVAGILLHRFRQLNGVRVDGLTSRLVLGTGALATTSYLGALAAAVWAGFGEHWLLVGVLSLIGGSGYALGVREWWRSYRDAPTTSTAGASPLLLAVLALVACAGLVALALLG